MSTTHTRSFFIVLPRLGGLADGDRGGEVRHAAGQGAEGEPLAGVEVDADALADEVVGHGAAGGNGAI
jgi:hypothetical protein